ncbi:MAG: PilZ domain-containing protein, partial [Planctomycetales bacterium]|nr:PilZ domain-containing protein [Planctomycetales bacterium]
RAVDRQPFTRPVRVVMQRGELALSGFTRDISRHGVSIILPEAVHSGMIAALEVHSLFGRSFVVRAENRWCDTFGEGWYASGWFFLESF